MIVFPNAKINLGLYIIEKRPDGFHNLQSLFYPVPCKDVLEIKEAKKNAFYSYNIPIPGDPQNNLCWKVYELLQTDFPNRLPPVEMHLFKNIPIGAGLGGGSADASFCLNALNELFNLNLSTEKRKDYALQIGSDCPFFIENQVAIAEGQGELLEPFELDLSGYELLLLYPNLHINTGWAYSQIKPQKPSNDLKEILQLPIDQWQGRLINDFEAPISQQHPPIAEAIQTLKAAGAIYCAMSGSGSTVFGIFESDFDFTALKVNLHKKEQHFSTFSL